VISNRQSVISGRWQTAELAGHLEEITDLFCDMKFESYQNLVAWRKAIDLCEAIYKASSAFPPHELYGLTSQIRRAAVSVPSNIAEGTERITNGEFLQSVGHARGSLLEVETQVIIAQRFGYIQSAETDLLLRTTNETGRLLNGLIRSLLGKRSY
jgi:four helix bundle protein